MVILWQKMNRGTMNSLITFLLWVVFFHSTSCNAFIFSVQDFQSPKTPSMSGFNSFKTFSKNGKFESFKVINGMFQIDKEKSLILSVPNDGPALVQLSVPLDGPASTFEQLSVLNDISRQLLTSIDC
jgi:hypothetical protein